MNHIVLVHPAIPQNTGNENMCRNQYSVTYY